MTFDKYPVAARPSLTLVGDPSLSIAERSAAAFAAAQLVASEHANMLRDSLAESERLASEVSAGGEQYPPGVRNLARELSNYLRVRLATLDTIGSR